MSSPPLPPDPATSAPAHATEPPPSTQPMPASFQCDVARNDHYATIRAVGELDIASAPVLSAQLTQLRDAGCRRIVIDLGGLVFLDSSGLRLLLECAGEARRDGFTLGLLPGPPAVQRVFEITATTDHLPFIDS